MIDAVINSLISEAGVLGLFIVALGVSVVFLWRSNRTLQKENLAHVKKVSEERETLHTSYNKEKSELHKDYQIKMDQLSKDSQSKLDQLTKDCQAKLDQLYKDNLDRLEEYSNSANGFKETLKLVTSAVLARGNKD